MNNFCTLFDRNYLYKGLTMYYSLLENSGEDFNLWILCMDNITLKILKKMHLKKVRLVSLADFENYKMLEIKKNRTVAEYSWTCASNFLWFLIQKNREIRIITYIDSDLFFFNDPQILIDELGNNDVIITEHRYTKKYDQSETSGKYCVQFMVFRNSKNGRKVLNSWRKSCLDWCFAYLDNNRFGDQKYLDDWIYKFKGVHELKHLGGGVAPWNVQQYNFSSISNRIYGQEKFRFDYWPLIFYHFHSFCLLSDNEYFAARGYELSNNTIENVYESYFKHIQKVIFKVKKCSPTYSYGYKKIGAKEKIVSQISRFGIIKKLIKSYKIIKEKIW